jgi:hypothetical protein
MGYRFITPQLIFSIMLPAFMVGVVPPILNTLTNLLSSLIGRIKRRIWPKGLIVVASL